MGDVRNQQRHVFRRSLAAVTIENGGKSHAVAIAHTLPDSMQLQIGKGTL